MNQLIEKIVEAWRIESPPICDQFEDFDEALWVQAENLLGRNLPDDLKQLYREHADKLEILGGNLSFNPIGPGKDKQITLIEGSKLLREWEWPVPDELIIFGDNGAGDHFGLWLPENAPPSPEPPVIMLGQLFEPGCMAIVGTSLERFLLGWSAYYLPIEEPQQEALDLLGVPQELRTDDFDDNHLERIFRWADPSLPSFNCDPYEQRLSAEDLRKKFNS